MKVNDAIKVADNYRKCLKPGCEMDRALTVLLTEARRSQYNDKKRQREEQHNNMQKE